MKIKMFGPWKKENVSKNKIFVSFLVLFILEF